jgi:hypothetical protein
MLPHLCMLDRSNRINHTNNIQTFAPNQLDQRGHFHDEHEHEPLYDKQMKNIRTYHICMNNTLV